jgi:hypothetical protein
MAKLQLIGNYKKRQVTKDANGLPVLNPVTNLPESKLMTMWRYGLVEATPQELADYKKFKNQDGDYYREEAGVPIYITSDYQGKTCNVRSYTNDEGRIGFVLDTTEMDELSALAEKFPALAGGLQAQQMAMMQAGTRLKLKELSSTDEGGDDENGSDANGGGEEGKEGKENATATANAGAGGDEPEEDAEL